MLGLFRPCGFGSLGGDDAIDALAVIGFLEFEREAELLAHDPREEPAHGMLLPAGGLHDRRDGRPLRSAQEREHLRLLGFARGFGLSRLTWPSPLFAAFGRDFVAGSDFTWVGRLLFDILVSSVRVMTARRAATTEAPRRP